MEHSFIKNRTKLATTKLRTDAVEIIEAGLSAVDTKRVMHEAIVRNGNIISTDKKNIDLAQFDRVFVVAIGKCAVDAASVLDEVLGDKITGGIVLDVKKAEFKHLSSYAGTHPFPSDTNVSTTKSIVEMLTGLTDRDIVFTVISGGGSALFSLPHKMTLETLHTLVKDLWKSGATISEVNTIRKHASDVSGGKLAELIYPATLVSFIFSDVPGNSIDTIASGPTALDSTSKLDAEKILRKYHIRENPLLASIELIETPKEKGYFEQVHNILVVSNDKALVAMKTKAEMLGYRSKIETNKIEGFANELGQDFSTRKIKTSSCLLFGGESTVKIKGDGKGGRNQEVALSALQKIDNHRLVVAVSSDGWDNSDIAGAFADASGRKHAEELGISINDFLDRNDSYHFWKQCRGGIETGLTGINVADFYFILTE